MTYTIEILDKHALILLRELEQMHVIRISPQQEKKESKASPKKEFKATKIDTRSFNFNREEANER